jgi:hypothetical protein
VFYCRRLLVPSIFFHDIVFGWSSGYARLGYKATSKETLPPKSLLEDMIALYVS